MTASGDLVLKGNSPCHRFWFGSLQDPRPGELTELWCFNEGSAAEDEAGALHNDDGEVVHGRVPVTYQVTGLVVGLSPEVPGEASFSVYIYFEFAAHVKVRRTRLARWFPRCDWRPVLGNTYEAAQYCRRGELWRERGVFSYSWQKQAPLYLSARIPYPDDLDMRARGFRWQLRVWLFLVRTKPVPGLAHVVANTVCGKGRSRFIAHMAAKHGMLRGDAINPVANYGMWRGHQSCLLDVPWMRPGLFEAALEKLAEHVREWQERHRLNLWEVKAPHIAVTMNYMPKGLGSRSPHTRWNFVLDALQDRMQLHDLFPPSLCPDVAHLKDSFAR